MKSYYDILEIKPFENNQDTILSAYKNLTSRFEKALALQDNTKQEYISALKNDIIKLNEAFLVLSDKFLKIEYDKALCEDNFSNIESRLAKKRNEASEFVNAQFLKNKNISIWKFIGITLILIISMGYVVRCVNSFITAPTYKSTYSQNSTNLGNFTPDSTWQRYDFYEAFSIYIPKTMELRSDYDKYSKHIHNNNIPSFEGIVFQQRGLSNMTQVAYNTYSRVLIDYFQCNPGEVPRYFESPKLSKEDIETFTEMVDMELCGFDYINRPTFQWVEIFPYKAVEATYKRNGLESPVSCKIYFLFNYVEMVKITFAWRDCDASLWESDLNNVIKTFKWE